jgi:uncharacterized protein YacL
MGWDYWLLRAVLVILAGLSCLHFRPFGLPLIPAVTLGITGAVALILLEFRLRHASLRRLIGGAAGSIVGVLAAVLMSMIFMRLSCAETTRSFLSIAALLGSGYIGLVIGANKGEMLNLQAFGGIFGAEPANHSVSKVLDTSVIIDGRVADISEAHFLDGNILIPQFVLRELQLVADSSDPLKRQRGRRGLEVLGRIQKMPHLDVRIVEDDFPHIADVDMKLIELAKRAGAKIVTNDFNLNKVATVQGIDILNVNQLANALKPVVLPGEAMRVFILREGKEYNQGVAYLDDGTMVVVDGARRLINKTVDIIVTSVHQTTAGKMIFGRLDLAGKEPEPASRQTAAAAGSTEANGRRAETGRPSESAGERAPRPVFPEPGE